DRYRHVVERVSKRTKKSEPEIARIALRMAQEAHDQSEDTSRAHVGYFLVGEGLSRLESEVRYRPRLREQMLRAVERHAALAYLGTFAAVTALIVGVTVVAPLQAGAG